MNSNLLFEMREEGIGILKVNRPDALNALNTETLKEMLFFLENEAPAKHFKAIILTGAGEKSFIAGADIKEMQEMLPLQMLRFCELGQKVSLALEKAPFLTLAAVNGYALGGGLEMALACDFIYAASNAKMGLPEVHLGIIPGFGGTQRLADAIGSRMAKELIMSGRTFLAEEALQMGIVNRICTPETLLEQCIATANEIVKSSFIAIQQAKRAVNGGRHMAMAEALEFERNMCAVCFGTTECTRGIAAFLEKRGSR